MPQLLHLDSSADLRTSRSRAVTRSFADAWQSVSPSHLVTYRDLHASPLPHLPDSSLHWSQPDAEVTDPRLVEARQRQGELIEELLAADAILVGAPLYNYSVPSTLKAWLDYIHVPGVTALAPPNQPLTDRPAVIVTARGLAYPPGSEQAHKDHATPLLRLILGDALGMEITVISADLTLADTVPSLAEHQGDAAEQLAAAHQAAADAGREIGRRLAP